MFFIAHRANDNHRFKENSKEAIKFCLNKNYIDGIEFDIRLTKDNIFVLSHDLIYEGKIIKSTNLKDLKGITTLKEVLKILPKNKIIFIDIKEFFEEEKVSNLLIKYLKKYKYLNMYLCSFNYSLLKKINTYFKTGLIIGNVINKNYKKEFDIYLVNKNNQSYKIEKTYLWTINKNTNNIKAKGVISDNCYMLRSV